MNPYRSHINPATKLVSESNWVISLIRSEILFLVVEGIDDAGENVIFRRYDFEMAPLPKDSSLRSSGVVRIRTEELHEDLYDTDQIKDFFYALIKGSSSQEYKYFGQSWHISKEQAAQLDEAIQKDVKNPPTYRVPENKSFGASPFSKSNDDYNTWPISKLKELEHTEVTRSLSGAKSTADFIKSLPLLQLAIPANTAQEKKGFGRR